MKEHLGTTWTHIRRSPYQALAAVGIMSLSFFAASVFALVAVGSHVILNFFETRPQVTAFFKDEETTEKLDLLKAKLSETRKVKEMKYVSKDEALEIYREQNKDNPLLLEMVTANILPASLEVSTTDISYLKEIAQILREEPEIEEVIFQEDIIQALNRWTSALRKVGIGLISALGLVSFLIILIIIGMKVAMRQEEIEILQLIGARSWYIWAPFILEGVFYGLWGAIFGWGAGYLLLLYSTPVLIDFLSGIPVLPVPILFMLAMLGAEIVAGVIIGVFGSLLAVKRYIK